MPEFAQFFAFENTDAAFRLPNGTITDRVLRYSPLANLDPERTVILMFKVAASGRAHLKVTVNAAGVAEIDVTLDGPPGPVQPRSWHEIVPGSRFTLPASHLLVEVDALEQGATITVSDFVLLYHAKTP